VKTEDIIFRLRVRANNAAANNEHPLADDLRLAIGELERLARELELTRALHHPRSPQEELSIKK
jgi:hypothetical protein